MEVRNGYIYITLNKPYIIPLLNINKYIMSNDEFLQNISMKDLKDVFVYGIPNNFKNYLLKKVSLYDSSSEINSFKYNDKEYWLDKTLRTSIANLLYTLNENEVDIILGDDIYTFKTQDIKNLLDKLEQYAYKCKINTLKHINSIKNIKEPTSKEEVENYIQNIINYDYTTGYPEKITIE